MAQFLDLFGHELSQQGAHVVAQPDAGLLGVFGGQRLQEDDAERAVASALGIDRRRAEANLLLADVGCELTTRTGLHRGFVSKRAGADAPLQIGGETIGLARSLSESAPINGTVGTGDALDGLKDWLRLQPFTRLRVPERSRSLDVYEILGTIRGLARGGAGPGAVRGTGRAAHTSA